LEERKQDLYDRLFLSEQHFCSYAASLKKREALWAIPKVVAAKVRVLVNTCWSHNVNLCRLMEPHPLTPQARLRWRVLVVTLRSLMASALQQQWILVVVRLPRLGLLRLLLAHN
jgi:hypothetical protein